MSASTETTPTEASAEIAPAANYSRSRLNAFRHGLTGRKFDYSPEDAEAYHTDFSEIQAYLKPDGPIEAALVRQIADGIWLLDRASAIEHGIFALAFESEPDPTTDANPELDAALAPARVWLAQGKNLSLLTLYVKRIQNKLDADKKELERVQSLRAQPKAPQSPAKSEATVPNREDRGKPKLVNCDKSDFSTRGIAEELAQMDALLESFSPTGEVPPLEILNLPDAA